MPWYAGTNTRHIFSMPSTNTYRVVAVSIEEGINIEDK